MISSNVTKQNFIAGNLKEADIQSFISAKVQEGFGMINKAQLDIYYDNLYREGKELKQKIRKGKHIQRQSGALESSLNRATAQIITAGTNFMLTATILKQLRFLDMKKKGNWRIYNAQVWGILYNNTYPDIKYALGSHVKDQVNNALHKAMSASNNTNFSDQYNKAKGR